ncbi:MAG: CinA family protein [SAR324 cluster bacterium]|nr:CinA family protein [SAR324 cluster bacterium]
MTEAMSDDAINALPLNSTLFFPISGNPVGFNHFAAAEALLRGNPAWEQVVFILSNGLHPDPTKPPAEASPEQRMALAQRAIAEIADAERSHLARLAERSGETLRISPACLYLSTSEFGLTRAVRTAETVQTLWEAHSGPDNKINWFAGSDLIARMADPIIFSGEDLAALSRQCHYAILEREGYPLDGALHVLAAERGCNLDYQASRAAELPQWLTPFLALSSTLIRRAAEAGDPLGAMLPDGAAQLIADQGLYRQGRPVAELMTPQGDALGARTAWQMELERLTRDLDGEAAAMASHLAANHEQGRPHTISLVEATVGGLLTQAFAGRSGASRYFRQSRFAYDERAKQSLLDADIKNFSAVSGEMVTALAKGMREQAGTEFAFAESGMAGPPDGRRRSFKNGCCHMALVTPKSVHTEVLQLNPFLTRREHQLSFTVHALRCIRGWLEADGY